MGLTLQNGINTRNSTSREARRSVLFAVMALVFFCSPAIVGAFDIFPYALIAVAVSLLVTYAFRMAAPRWSKPVALMLLSVCFAVTFFDLSARPVISYMFEVRPSERFIYRWPPLPQLQRYKAGVNFEGLTFGDLADVSGRRDWRKQRRIRFVTDEYGFRNEPQGVETRPLDVIVLGDSFGVAAGTSQEEILSSLLVRDYGLSVYNLSISRQNPQQEYANLFLEAHRLKTRANTCILWLIFSGNDLDEAYYPELEVPWIPFLDLKPTLVEASRTAYEKSAGLLWWRDDTHSNGDGQRVAAAAIYDNFLQGIQTR